MNNLLDNILQNPLLPYFFLDVINSKKNTFWELFGLDGKSKKIAEDLREYVNRYKTLKSHYLQDNCYITKDFLCSHSNIENILYYFIHIVSQNTNIHPYFILYKIDEYLNGKRFNNE